MPVQVEKSQQPNKEILEIVKEMNTRTVRNISLKEVETCVNCLESLFKPNLIEDRELYAMATCNHYYHRGFLWMNKSLDAIDQIHKCLIFKHEVDPTNTMLFPVLTRDLQYIYIEIKFLSLH